MVGTLRALAILQGSGFMKKVEYPSPSGMGAALKSEIDELPTALE